MTSPTDSAPVDPAEWRRTTRALQRIARSVVGDAALSEDIVQNAWVHALERGDTRPGFGWLKKIVRSRSIDVQRRRRALPGHEVLQPEDTADGAASSEVASRIELQRAVLDAVEQLATPYRDTIYLRYFEAFTPRDIAVRLDVPLKTIETRLTRAHALLRERLGRDLRSPGDGRWAPALVAFAHPPSLSPVAITATSPALLAVLTMKKVAIASIALALALLVAGWFAISLLRTPSDAGSADPVDRSARNDIASAQELAPVTTGTEPERSALGHDEEAVPDALVPAPPSPTSGTLRVSVRWSDGTPAEGVGVIAASASRQFGVRRRFRRVTGANGVTEFPQFPPGAVYMETDRNYDEGEVFEVLAGETANVVIELDDGLDVVGSVVDSTGNAVPGAGIWLTAQTARWTSGGIVTESDAAGRFRLRDLPDGPSLGALARGYLPSLLVDLDLLDKNVRPIRIELVVNRGGGSLAGAVIDSQGLPVPDAVVVLGKHDGTIDMRFDDTTAEAWTFRTARTDADGQYRIDALETGSTPLSVRHHGWPQWSGTVEISAGAATRQDITLHAGATVRGVAQNAAGATVPGARIHAFDRTLDETFLASGQVDYDGAFAQEAAIVGGDGSYVLDNLPRGKVFLYAMAPRQGRRSTMQYAKISVELAEGEVRTWDPTLSDGRVIAGSVRYSDGAPIKGIFINLKSIASETSVRRAVHTEDGTFRFIQLPEGSYDVGAQIWELPEGEESPRQQGVVAGGAPIELVADFEAPIEYEPGTVRVKFVDAGERAAGASSIVVALESLDRYMWRIGDAEDDVWTFDMRKPGRFRVIAFLGERLIAVGDAFDYVPGTDVDLGVLASAPGGTLLLRINRSEEHLPEGMRLRLTHDAYRHGESLEIGSGSEVRLKSMQPGTGTLTLTAANLVRREIPFEIRAGEETVLDIPLIPAVSVRYRIDLPALAESTSLSARFLDRVDGSTVREIDLDDARRYASPIEWSANLMPGEYRIEVELGDGRRAHADFSVTSLNADDAPNPKIDLR